MMARVLVVEDDARSLLVIASLLKSLEIEYKRNTTGSGVLEQIENLQPSCILLDLDLPEGDALAICHGIRAHDTIHPIPVVALASDVSPAERLLLCQAGFSAILSKPLSPLCFTEVICAILNRDLVGGQD